MAKRELTEEEIARRERWGRVHVDADRRKPFGFVTAPVRFMSGVGSRRERGGYKAGNTSG